MASRKKARGTSRGQPKPKPAPVRKRRKGSLSDSLRLLLKGFVLLTLLLGFWIYWPRDARPFVPGLGIESECAVQPQVKMTAQLVDASTYRLGLSFGNLKQLSCKELRITAPAELIDVIQIHDIQEISVEALRSARQPFREFRLTRNVLGQPVMNIPAANLGAGPFSLEMTLGGVIQDSFEKFRLLIPRAVNINGGPELSARPPIELESIVIASRFDTLEVSPQANAQKSQFGAEMLYFNSELSEVNILVLDRSRDMWKTVYNIFALAIVVSVLATAISNMIQGARPAPR